eukprot:gnl/MRDRNA2_/MRDRNA2_90211_c0_seq1.p1 gnl/MRDRNA2_/MRDRNA2_90211_c0~~gnl/MRDRNA2_/MRDRNA2_90211_c0_seq1.p1  ORF type:complete len:124 (-),score=12.36 gnl/MRDRNA2_/MRDRNA2_90211_c0_seq1:861-1232(-)
MNFVFHFALFAFGNCLHFHEHRLSPKSGPTDIGRPWTIDVIDEGWVDFPCGQPRSTTIPKPSMSLRSHSGLLDKAQLMRLGITQCTLHGDTYQSRLVWNESGFEPAGLWSFTSISMVRESYFG